jgi:hypothetical protein
MYPVCTLLLVSDFCDDSAFAGRSEFPDERELVLYRICPLWLFNGP